jgi:hypothetical protein
VKNMQETENNAAFLSAKGVVIIVAIIGAVASAIGIYSFGHSRGEAALSLAESQFENEVRGLEQQLGDALRGQQARLDERVDALKALEQARQVAYSMGYQDAENSVNETLRLAQVMNVQFEGFLGDMSDALASPEARQVDGTGALASLSKAVALASQGKFDEAEELIDRPDVLFAAPDCLQSVQFASIEEGDFFQSCVTGEILALRRVIYTSASSEIEVGIGGQSFQMELGGSHDSGSGCSVTYVSVDPYGSGPRSAQFMLRC